MNTSWLRLRRREFLKLSFSSVFCSAEFRSIVEISLKAVVDTLVELMVTKVGGGNSTSGVPLAKLLPHIAHICPLFLEEPSKNQFIQTIKNLREVELFFTYLYANVPSDNSALIENQNGKK